MKKPHLEVTQNDKSGAAWQVRQLRRILYDCRTWVGQEPCSGDENPAAAVRQALQAGPYARGRQPRKDFFVAFEGKVRKCVRGRCERRFGHGSQKWQGAQAK